MAITVQKFISLANFYNQMAMMMSAICVQKGGIALEHYVGRFFMADTLEFVAEYGKRLLDKNEKNLSEDVIAVIKKFQQQYEKIKDLTTPTEKPIYEMTLEEFERVMNI